MIVDFTTNLEEIQRIENSPVGRKHSLEPRMKSLYVKNELVSIPNQRNAMAVISNRVTEQGKPNARSEFRLDLNSTNTKTIGDFSYLYLWARNSYPYLTEIITDFIIYTWEDFFKISLWTFFKSSFSYILIICGYPTSLNIFLHFINFTHLKSLLPEEKISYLQIPK
jgi:hypothetical protein